MNAANGPAAAVDDIRKDLQTLREDVLRLAGQVSTLVSATGDQAMGDVKQRIRQMGDTVSDLSERGTGHRDRYDRRCRRIARRKHATRPLATIAVAVGLGFIVGALWRR